MSRFFAFALLMGLSGPILSAGPETLLKADTSFPAQGGPAFKISYLGGPLGIMVGGRGALMLGENMSVGAGGYSLASEVVTELGGVKRDLSFVYGGVVIENNFFPRRLWFLNVSTLVGPGWATGSQRTPAAEKDRTLFFVVEPELNIMLNLTREIRLGLGLAYRLTAGSQIAATLGTDLGGVSVSATFLYGKI